MTYKEKLLDPRWQKKRLKILERDNFKCVKCDDEKSTLHIHHLEYTGNPWDVSDDKLATLCCHCHAIIEDNNFDYDVFKAISFSSGDGSKFLIVSTRSISLFASYNKGENVPLGFHLDASKKVVAFLQKHINRIEDLDL